MQTGERQTGWRVREREREREAGRGGVKMTEKGGGERERMGKEGMRYVKERREREREGERERGREAKVRRRENEREAEFQCQTKANAVPEMARACLVPLGTHVHRFSMQATSLDRCD